MKNAKGIALTSGFWTSLGNKSNCGVTGQWITDDWKLKSVAPECVNVVEHHYSENIAGLYKVYNRLGYKKQDSGSINQQCEKYGFCC